MNIQLPSMLAALQASLSRTGFDDWYQLSLDKEELRDQHDALVNGLKNERALTEMFGQFRAKHPFHQADLELLHQALIAQQIFGVLNAVKQFV